MANETMERHWKQSHLSAGTQEYLDQMYDLFLTNPEKLDQYWIDYFSSLPVNLLNPQKPYSGVESSHRQVIQQFKNFVHPSQSSDTSSSFQQHLRQTKHIRVSELINAYRVSGHKKADIDPLQRMERSNPADLELAYHNLTDEDLSEYFSVNDGIFEGEPMTLQSIIDAMEKTYCSSIGVEIMHIPELEERRWLQSQFEPCQSSIKLSEEEKKHLLRLLTSAEGLETYLANRYPGAKRFGLEGGESLVPLLDTLIHRSGDDFGVTEVVLGMAHRGRLNVLVNILGKKPADLFGEFEGKQIIQGSGDVKYHQGFSSNVMTDSGELHLAMAFNPSHLEIVNPVVNGSVRARQDRRGDKKGDKVVPILVHGDASFAGQGVVMENLQLSNLRGYRTGGSVHVIVNNQIGFTTSDLRDVRSTEYCTDVAKMVNLPIFHVNGDDPEAVLLAARIALDYRMRFNKDVVIDLLCYRRRGHNEADEPWVTQPRMYSYIASQEKVRTKYSKQLIAQGVITPEEDTEVVNTYRQLLESGEAVTDSIVTEPNSKLLVDWTPYLNKAWHNEFNVQVSKKKLSSLGKKIYRLPEGLTAHKQVKKIYDDRLKMVEGKMPINWGCAEMLSYASILDEGYSVRMTGQDCRRGTFAHRHAVVHDQANFDAWSPLRALEKAGRRFHIFDSFLSEEAVLAYEYGYSTTTPSTLVIWEAQFGDFANNAQVVIDQFITSGENKWQRLCGLVLLLPHGFEGQGPEHSSARQERFLQMCAEHNIQLCIPTTPSQIFHLLRRQMLRTIRKPLVVMTPKSLLRHKDAVSSVNDLVKGTFEQVLDEVLSDIIDKKAVKRIIISSGKVYYDLLNARRERKIYDTALIRIEQIYPYPTDTMKEVLSGYPNATTIVWCQEEPRNQGAWHNSQHWTISVLEEVFGTDKLHYAGRESSAAPAVGSTSVHQQQQLDLVNMAFSVS